MNRAFTDGAGAVRSQLREQNSWWWLKVLEVIRLLLAEGWFLVAIRGSHRQFKHPSRPGRVTVAGQPSDTHAPGSLKSITRQSGVSLP